MKKASDRKEKIEVQELRKQLARALADYDNLQKRTAKEKEEWTKFANKALVTKFLPIYDMILSAQKHIGDPGIAIVVSNFENILAEEGIEIIRPKIGEKFDEGLHEALDAEEANDPAKAGKISSVVLPGFRFKDGMVIRHAKVNVFKS